MRSIIKKSVLEGFSYTDFSTSKIIVTLGISFVLALYIFFVYRKLTENTFYNKNFNVAMAIIAVVTSGIVMAMQSNLVISLGMVGALSIVRFRTAIKEPMDLLFLFWSIGIGIISGAGLYKMAILLSLAVTVGLLILQVIPAVNSPLLLIVKNEDVSKEQELMDLVKEFSPKYKVDSKSVVKGCETLIIEIKTDRGSELVNKLSEISGVASVSIMQHEGEVKG